MIGGEGEGEGGVAGEVEGVRGEDEEEKSPRREGKFWRMKPLMSSHPDRRKSMEILGITSFSPPSGTCAAMARVSVVKTS